MGSFEIRRKEKPTLECKCVTMIDSATDWFEIKQFDDKFTITIANIVEQKWLSRYPRHTQITYDSGIKFIGHDFWHMVKHDNGIKNKPISVRNLQANAIVEHIH